MYDESVLLGKGLDEKGNENEIRGTTFNRRGILGVAESIRDSQDAGIRVPCYLLTEGRITAGIDCENKGDIGYAFLESVWNNWHDALSEKIYFDVKKDYGYFKPGKYVVDIENGSIFSHDYERMKEILLGEEKIEVKRKPVPVNEKDADMFFGDKQVYAQKDGKMKAIKPDYIFTSEEEFSEASSRPDFLKGMPVYAIIRTLDEAIKVPSGYRSIDSQRENFDLAIRTGGFKRANELLDTAKKKGFEKFSCIHDGYNHPNTGRIIVVNSINFGFGFGSFSRYEGNSVSIDQNSVDDRDRALESTIEAMLGEK